MTQTDLQSGGNPLQSERGTTTIEDAVVTSVVNVAAQEIEGVFREALTSSGACPGLTRA